MSKNRYTVASFVVRISSFVLVGCALFVSGAYAEIVSSKDLIENANTLDGKTVRYRGEIVTAILNRGEYSWANLNDGDNAVGVWCPSSLLDAVKFIGDYKNKGDVLETEGVFHRACSAHNGELDIHADSVKIIKAGFSVSEGVDSRKLNISAAIFLLTILLVAIFRKRI